MSLRRPPVSERKTADYGPTHMAGYIEGLEARLARHVERHAPDWQHKEAGRTLRRWSAMANNHPAPRGAAPRNHVLEAKEYAAMRVGQRIAQRFEHIGAIKLKVLQMSPEIKKSMELRFVENKLEITQPKIRIR